MKLTKDELAHLLFLAGVVCDGNKRTLMAETIECLSYIVKSLTEVDLPEGVVHRIHNLTLKVEEELRQENDRLHEIRHNLDTFGR